MDKMVHYFSNAVAINGYLWFAASDINALMRVNIETKECDYVLSFPDEKNTIKRLYGNVKKVGGKIVFYPNGARKIAIYDSASGNIGQIMVDCEKGDWETASMYGGCPVGNNVYLFRRGYNGIYRLNVLSEKLEKIDVLQKKNDLQAKDSMWYRRLEQVKNDLVLYDKIHHVLYRYNEEMRNAEILFSADREEILDFASDGRFIWFLTDKDLIYKMDGNQIVDKYGYNTHETNKLGLLCFKEKLFVINMYGERARVFLLSDNSGEKEWSLPLYADSSEIAVFIVEKGKLFVQYRDGRFYYKDEEYEITATAVSDMDEVPAEVLLPNSILTENVDFPLESLFYYTDLYNKNVVNTGRGRQDMPNGSKIHKIVNNP